MRAFSRGRTGLEKASTLLLSVLAINAGVAVANLPGQPTMKGPILGISQTMVKRQVP